jgi:hypothetical protein
MKIKILLSAVAAIGGSLLAAQADPADDVTAAAQKLGSESSYSWHTTVVVPPDSRFKPGPTDGKIADGMNYVKMTFGDNTTEIFMKGTNAVLTNPDGGWQTLADMDDSQFPGRMVAGMVRNFRTPSAQVQQLLSNTTNLQQTAGAYTGDLTAAGAKTLLSFRGRGGANISNPSGTVQFWVANGELAKYEFHVKGTTTFNDNDVTIDRDTTVEIKDAGATKIDMPDDAKKLMP